ncbi:alcohol dehydrogenase [Fistulina hepatica ATCC 64428]|uniref:Alcohol dehydrogenase n=1 Tax=Fistulina hepatica ATCC 64428 TaxID=1128425 RepID=A0A0D7ACD4_9AGAR|nr:alcohol dehydrogenase [Fistulina hepatica ATCC 64428]
MRGYVVRENQHFSKVPLETDVPIGIPGPDEVVDVYCAGLNFFDILQTEGRYQIKHPHPFTLGTEFAGVISTSSPIPPGCPFKRGDRVFGANHTGAFAEQIVAKLYKLLPLPDNLTFREGAGLHTTWPTSYEALVSCARVQPGEWVLVAAAAGGVGIPAVQIAKHLGAKVIAAAGSQAKLDLVLGKSKDGLRFHLCADYGINYNSPGWQNEVKKITGGHGVNVVFDPVGIINASLKCIAWKGRALVIGFAGGNIEKVPMNLILLKNISLVGLHWGAYDQKEYPREVQVWCELLELLSSEKLKPVVYPTVYPFERLADGFAALASRRTFGNVSLTIREEPSTSKSKL